MKKKLVLLTILILAAIMLFVGCKTEKRDVISDAISEKVENVLLGNDSEFDVKMTYGSIENPALDDGICKNVSKFVKVELKPKSTGEYKNIQYRLSNGAEKSEGIVLQGLLGNTYNVTLRDFAVRKLSDLKLYIKNNEQQEREVVLTQILTDTMATASEVFEIAKTEFADELNKMKSKDGFNGEIKIKLINQKDMANDKYFWFVKVIKADKSYIALLINPTTKIVLVKKI